MSLQQQLARHGSVESPSCTLTTIVTAAAMDVQRHFRQQQEQEEQQQQQQQQQAVVVLLCQHGHGLLLFSMSYNIQCLNPSSPACSGAAHQATHFQPP
jgi:hypothetical protein